MKITIILLAIGFVVLMPFSGANPLIADENHEYEHDSAGFNWWRLVKPLGIVTIILLFLTATLGLLRKVKYNVMIKAHKICAVITLISALMHAILIISL